MRASWLSLVGTIAMVVFGGSGGAVVAQETDGDSTVWLSPTKEDVFSVLGVRLGENEPGCKHGEPSERRVLPDRSHEVLGMLFTCQVTYSDPRLSGTQTTMWNERCFSAGGCVNWGTQEIVGPDGTWTGWLTGSEDPDGNTNLYMVLTGTGDYVGLTSIRHASGRFWKPLDQVGLIYGGDPPPVLAPAPAPAPSPGA
jgi:hypothetical protein